MKRALIWTLLLWALLALPAAARAEKPVLEYYYENYCESCHPDEEFAEQFRTLTLDDAARWDYRSFNVVTSAGRAAYDEMLYRQGLEDRRGSMPVAVMEGHAFVGTAEIAEKLPEYAVSRLDSRDSALHCLNLDADDEVRALVDELPETIRVTLGRYAFDSPVRVERAEGEQARALAERWGLESLPGEPVVRAGDSVYVGREEILRLLRFRLASGAAIRPAASTDEKTPPIGALCAAGGACAAAAMLGLNFRKNA